MVVHGSANRKQNGSTKTERFDGLRTDGIDLGQVFKSVRCNVRTFVRCSFALVFDSICGQRHGFMELGVNVL